MSRFDELLDQAKSQAQELWEKIQESEAYNQINDRYQSLSSTGQKATQVILILTIVGLFLYSPISQLSVSQNLISEFEAKRTLIRNLFKAYRDSSTSAQISPAPMSSELISNIQNSLSNARLLPEQIIAVSTLQAESKLIPESLLSSVIEVKLSKLNLRQIIDIGTQLVNISEAVKVKDMAVRAHSELKGYFDVDFKLYSLKVPESIPEPPPEVIEQPKKKKKSTNNNESNDE